jgi:ribonucleotide reductase alpha subunit
MEKKTGMTNKDYYWLNSHSRLFLERGYLEPGVTPEQRIRQIADNAESILKVKGFADKFEGYMKRGFYSLATPVWCNFGNKRGLPVSCFGSYVEDKMESILTKAAEVGIMSKMGGGTSGFFGALRPRGTKISVGGESSGAVHFMEIFDKVSEVISQGSARRGSFAAYMPIEHEDIEEFLRIRSEGHSIQNMSIGVTVTDKFMKDLIEGDKDKRAIWAKVIQKRFETGYPYIMFVDTANKNAPKVYKDKKLKIKASNLCVAPDTLLLTRDGEITIGDHEGEEVEVWNGKEWSGTVIRKTGTNQPVLEIKFVVRELDDDDTQSLKFSSLKATEYHKFYLKNGSEVRASELKPGDELLRFTDHRGRLARTEVLEVAPAGNSDTYCVNEPKEHKAVFNGVLTGNCSEIQLFSDEENSFVCVLSSLNLLHWDEMADTDAVETMVMFLDAVCEEFIRKTEGVKYMEAPRRFAMEQRALGLGVLGWHSYLQSKMIAFESMEAKMKNAEIWKKVRERADKTTEQMAKEYGEPPLLKGYGRRNVTTLAVAPTTSSSFILGQVSPSIEPLNSNYFVKNLAKGKFTYKNPYLKETLKKYERNDEDTWKTILVKGGSVQHLDFLTKEEKDVFKTFGEISQKEIVIQAAQRQKYIDQSQSLNLMIPPSTSPKDVNSLLIEGWEMGVKTFYYQRSANPAQELARSILTCSSCEA